MYKKTFQKLFLALLFASSALGVFYKSTQSEIAKPPISGQKPSFYSNEAGDNLSKSFLNAIDRAENSITLMIYSLTDRQILSLLRQKAESGIKVRIIADNSTSPGLEKKLSPKIKFERRQTKGLMHLKVLIVDHEEIWLGSANFTSESLRMHGNLVTSFKDKSLGLYLEKVALSLCIEQKKDPFFPNPAELNLGGQEVQVWLLPCQTGAVQKIRELLRSAKKSIKIAMYTWTRYDIANDVISAKRRGVDVEVKLDRSQAQGASKKVYELLKQNGVNVSLNQGPELLHYKMAWIDEKILINGSANWTKNAFTVNDDIFMVISPLTQEQNHKLWQLWKN